MQMHGEGGTGKSTVINLVTKRFEEMNVAHWLRKGAYTGVASSIIGGSTLHTLAKISGRGRISKAARNSLADLWSNVYYFIIDEISMVDREFFAKVSRAISSVRLQGNSDAAFGSLNVILCGDFHQFPPVVRGNRALFFPANAHTDSADAVIGRKLYEQFTTVVILQEQVRTGDTVWRDFLRRLRHGSCTEADFKMLQRLDLRSSPVDVTDPRWRDAILVTPRNAMRKLWNKSALRRHCSETGHRLCKSPARDTINGKELTLAQQYQLYRDTADRRLEDEVELAIGMRTLVTFNLHTELDLANGARGTVVDIILHQDEPDIIEDAEEVSLSYPPLYVLVELDKTKAKQLVGLPPKVVPIQPWKAFFNAKLGGGTATIERHQLPLTQAYAFTDYCSQGQTLEPVLLDLDTPPTGGGISPFNAYVACSRGTGQETVRFLRLPEYSLLTTHPSEALRDEDKRLEELDKKTKVVYLQGQS